MPCNSEWNCPNEIEQESHKVCRLLSYVYKQLGQRCPNRIWTGANSEYGNIIYLDNDTATLCGLCAGMTPDEQQRIIYDGRKPKARMLADWWERHQEWDKERRKQEKRDANRERLRRSALAKLTPEEISVLGL